MKRFAPVLISILVFVMFLMSNIMTAHALNYTLTLVDDKVAGIPCATHYYYVYYSGEALTPNTLMTANKTIKVKNVSDYTFRLYGNLNSNPQLLYIAPRTEYVLDNTFWEEAIANNSSFSADNGFYFTCDSNYGFLTDVGLEVTLLSSGDSSSGDGTTEGDGTTTEEDDDSGLFQSIKEFFSGLFEDIPTWIDNAVSSIGKFFSNLIEKIGEFFSDVGEWISNAVKDIGEFFSLVGEWIGNAVTSIVEFIGDFFTDLFEPILGWFENKRAEEETKQSFWEKMNEGLNKILDKIMGFTLVPIRDFFNNLVNSDVVFVLNEIYEFPIIKEMIILVVAVLVILGVLGLLLTY